MLVGRPNFKITAWNILSSKYGLKREKKDRCEGGPKLKAVVGSTRRPGKRKDRANEMRGVNVKPTATPCSTLLLAGGNLSNCSES